MQKLAITKSSVMLEYEVYTVLKLGEKVIARQAIIGI